MCMCVCVCGGVEIDWANNDMWKEERICIKIMVKVPKVKGKYCERGNMEGKI